MIAPDLETAISRLRELDRGRAGDCAFHRGRNFDRMRHSRFPLARRPVDQEPADPVRRLSGQPGDARRSLAAALRHGGEFRQGQAGPGASGAGEPLSRRQGAGAGDAEHRQSASGLRHRGRATSSNCTAIPPMPSCLDCARRYELAWVQGKIRRRGERAPDCDCGGYIKTATVSFGQAMPAEAMQRAEQLTPRLRSVSRHRLVAGGVAGGRISADGETQRRGPRHHQSRADRVRRASPIWWCATTSATCSRPFIAH